MSVFGRPVRTILSCVAALNLGACSTVSAVSRNVLGGPTLASGGQPITGFIGGVAADEARATLIGKQILIQGGSAADAAAAVGFALAVTLPSRAGLGGGGACLAFNPSTKSVNGGTPEAILFVAPAPAAPPSSGRPAAVPMLARGLIALQHRYGILPVEQVIAPAEQLARLGAPVSPGLASDLQVVGAALLADPASSAVFAPGGGLLATGDTLVQRGLGNTLARLRTAGGGDLYTGQLAQTLVAASPALGANLSADDLATALPRLAVPLMMAAGKDSVAFLPPPADGGLAAAAAFDLLQGNAKDIDHAQLAAIGAASSFRAGAGQGASGRTAAQPDTLTALPASTSFVTLDRTGGAVACALSMGNLFGTGRMVPDAGFLLAASPAAMPPALLAAALAWNRDRHAFRAEVAGSGQKGAAIGVADGMIKTLRSTAAMPSTVPDPGRINAIACAQYLPGNPDQCSWSSDPRGSGFAVGTN